jgi:hypothetical protein
MEDFFNGGISQVIQLAVAPVFLIASISGALNVLSLRMGRIIDRGRRLNEMDPDSKGYDINDVENEQLQLAERARLIHRAIALCTLSALFVCLVIVCLFLDAIFELHFSGFIAVLFVVALISLIVALITFLREIGMGTNALRFGRYAISKKHRRRS